MQCEAIKLYPSWFGTPGRILPVLFMLAMWVEEEPLMPIGLLVCINLYAINQTKKRTRPESIMISDNLKRPTQRNLTSAQQRSTSAKLRPSLLGYQLAHSCNRAINEAVAPTAFHSPPSFLPSEPTQPTPLPNPTFPSPLQTWMNSQDRLVYRRSLNLP